MESRIGGAGGEPSGRAQLCHRMTLRCALESGMGRGEGSSLTLGKPVWLPLANRRGPLGSASHLWGGPPMSRHWPRSLPAALRDGAQCVPAMGVWCFCSPVYVHFCILLVRQMRTPARDSTTFEQIPHLCLVSGGGSWCRLPRIAHGAAVRHRVGRPIGCRAATSGKVKRRFRCTSRRWMAAGWSPFPCGRQLPWERGNTRRTFFLTGTRVEKSIQL